MKVLRTILIESKDPLGPDEIANVIYGLECSQCPVDYITERPERGHTFSIDKIRLIDVDRSKGGRLLREA